MKLEQRRRERLRRASEANHLSGPVKCEHEPHCEGPKCAGQPEALP